MRTDHLELPPVRHTPQQTDSSPALIACSLCLRVRRGSQWIEAERVIAEIRSYELEALPRLTPALCDICAKAILNRRRHVGEPIAA
jgi:hypothetical protein